MKILIYGIGSGTAFVEKIIRSEHTIIGYIDSYSNLSVYNGKPFYKLEQIDSVSFDFIVIAIKNKKVAWDIYIKLSDEYKILNDNVIPLFVYQPTEINKIFFEKNPCIEVEGLILGNSHARDGIIPGFFPHRFVNLSVSSEDIYYHYKVFEECINKWSNNFNELKYVIIDLYDYCIFNIDISKTKEIMNYICMGGIIDEHNFKENNFYKKEFKEEIFENLSIIQPNETMLRILNMLFYGLADANINFGEEVIEKWNHISKNEFLDGDKFVAKVIKNRYENTLNENRLILSLLIERIIGFNSNIKIIFTLLPRYITMELVSRPFLMSWKNEFYEIMSFLREKYGVYFFDLKECVEISHNEKFYYDVNHLNACGGRALTSILNLMLFEQKIF